MINLMHGDCLERMKEIPDNSVDCCITDPPYGTTACKWDNVIPFEPMWEQLKRIVKDNGAICLFGSEPFSSHLRLSNLKMFKYDWVWHTGNKVTNFMNAKKQPLRNNEIVSVFYKKQCMFTPQMREGFYRTRKTKVRQSDNYGDMSKLSTDNNREVKKLMPVSVLTFNGRMTSNQLHPTQKPVDLLEYLIKTYTLEGETVLDFTAGSFSTGVACVNLDRRFIGIEKEKKYYDIGLKRVNDAKIQRQNRG